MIRKSSLSNHLAPMSKIMAVHAGQSYLEDSYCYRKRQRDMKAIQAVFKRIRGR